MVVFVPVPAIAPGLIVQFPAGKPFNTTLPVANEQVGWVIVPTVGADGVILTVSVAAFDVTFIPPPQFVI